MRVPVAIAALALAGGCNALLGVHGFGGSDGGGGGGDGGADDAPADTLKVECDPSKDFAAPELIKELEDPVHSVFVTDVDATGTILYLASDRGGGAPQMFQATLDTVMMQWRAPTLLSALTTEWAALTRDGLIAIAGAQRAASEDLFVEKRAFASDLFASDAGLAINTGGIEETPRLTRNEATLYFATDRGGGRRDIYTSKINGDTFGSPTLLDGIGLNTTINESAPALTADELTLYFTRGDQNNNGRDVLVVTRATTSALFNNPQKAVALNSGAEDIVGALSPDGCTIYINRIEDSPLRSRPYVAIKPP
jgi:WD40 repeat protein